MLIPKWLIAVWMAALVVSIGAMRLEVLSERQKFADARATWAEQSATSEREAREVAQENQRITARWHANQLEALNAQVQETRRIERIAAGLRTERDRLQGDIASYAAGEHRTGDDSTAACRDDAAQLGELLGQALRAHGECSLAAEQHATDLRAVLASWPVSPP